MALHYAPVNANAMRLYSVLINHGADPSAEDSRGHNPQYYIDHVDEILIPEWSNKWSNMIAAQSPEPRRKKSEREHTKLIIQYEHLKSEQKYAAPHFENSLRIWDLPINIL